MKGTYLQSLILRSEISLFWRTSCAREFIYFPMAGSPMKFAEMPTSEECGGETSSTPPSQRLYPYITPNLEPCSFEPRTSFIHIVKRFQTKFTLSRSAGSGLTRWEHGKKGAGRFEGRGGSFWAYVISFCNFLIYNIIF